MPAKAKRTVAVPQDPDSPFQRWMALSPATTGGELLRQLAERYLSVVRRSVPELTEREWCVIFEVLGPSWTAGEYQSLRIGPAVAAAISGSEVDQKWGVNGQDLISRIAQLPYAGLVAVGEVTEAFWKAAPRAGYAQVIQGIYSLLSVPVQDPPSAGPVCLSPHLLHAVIPDTPDSPFCEEKAGGAINPLDSDPQQTEGVDPLSGVPIDTGDGDQPDNNDDEGGPKTAEEGSIYDRAMAERGPLHRRRTGR